MARSTADINEELKQHLKSAFEAIGIAIDPAVWSNVNRLRNLLYIFSFQANKLETLYDNFSSDVEEALRQLKPPSKQWYKNKILNFQYGFPIVPGTDEFDNTGYTEQQIEDSKVIKHVAVIKQVNVYGRVRLRFKIASSNGTDIVQAPQLVADALTAYLDSDGVAAAGDYWEVENRPFDAIKMKWIIYYDPLILDVTGARLDGTGASPVKDAIISFLKDGITQFSGTYHLISHIDWVQKVRGVIIPEVAQCGANYGTLPDTNISTKYEPDGGWIRFATPTDLEIEYRAYNEV